MKTQEDASQPEAGCDTRDFDLQMQPWYDR